MKRIKLSERLLPDYTLGEEIFNAISHGVGVPLGIVVCVLCAIKTYGDLLPFIGALIFGCSMIVLYALSTLYHSFRPSITKKVFQILDHCTIYLLIAGTYTPILLTVIIPNAPVVGWGLLIFQWGVSVVAIVLNAIDLHYYRHFSNISYIALGWAIILVAPMAFPLLDPFCLLYLVLGGISYTVGAVAFFIGIKRHWFHSIFHVFVVLGSFLHFIAIYCYML